MKFGKGTFHGSLTVIAQSTELLGVETKFSRHLNLRMGKAVLLPRLKPRLELLGDSCSLHNPS